MNGRLCFLCVAVGLLAAAGDVAKPARVRLVQEKPAGHRFPLSIGTLFLPDALPREGPLPLFLHFHGPGWIAEVAAARSGSLAVLTAQLGSGSAVYAKPFTDPKALANLLREAETKSGRKLDLVGLSGWSAGYGAVRAILRVEDYYRQVRWVVLLDGMHASYKDDKREPLPAHLDAFVRFARDAAAGRKQFVITHTQIVPGSYASTTETADHVLAELSLPRTKANMVTAGLPLLSQATKGGLRVLGCSGNTAADHVDHLHALPALLPDGGKLRRIGPSAVGTSQAVVVDDVPLVHTGQLVPPDGKGTAEAQIEHLLDRLSVVLQAGDSDLDRLVRLHIVSAPEAVPAVNKALARRFQGAAKPALTLVVGQTVKPGVLVCLDAVAASGRDSKSGEVAYPACRGVSVAGGSPLAILPAGPVYHVAGQAERGKTLAECTRKTMTSLQATLKHLGRDLDHVVSVKAFLDPMTRAEDARAEIVAFFGTRPVPPLVFVEWTFAGSIEIELVASAAPPTRKAGAAVDYLTPPGMTASPIYSRVARINHGRRIYTSGLTGSGGDGAAQVKDVFAQLQRILDTAGGDFKNLAKATYYVSTEDASKQLNLLRPGYYDPKRPPSASKAPVKGVGKEGGGIAIDMIAVSKPNDTTNPR